MGRQHKAFHIQRQKIIWVGTDVLCPHPNGVLFCILNILSEQINTSYVMPI